MGKSAKAVGKSAKVMGKSAKAVGKTPKAVGKKSKAVGKEKYFLTFRLHSVIACVIFITPNATIEDEKMLTYIVYGDNLDKITLKATTLRGACQSAARRGFAELFVENQGIEIAYYAEVCGHWVKM